MDKHWKRVIGVLCCGVMSTAAFTAYADTYDNVTMIEGAATAGYEKENAVDTADSTEEATAPKVINRTEEGIAAQEEKEEQKLAQEAEEAKMVQENTSLRQQVVDYALSFVGGPYRYGGNDPRTGVDCSGFTRFVLTNAAGIPMSRSSGSQAMQGVAVSADQMQPGDLLFYSGGGRINHVAMYIGAGKIVHASTYETGIKISDWNYRVPVRIVNVLG